MDVAEARQARPGAQRREFLRPLQIVSLIESIGPLKDNQVLLYFSDSRRCGSVEFLKLL
jgi:hypothetical protein